MKKPLHLGDFNSTDRYKKLQLNVVISQEEAKEIGHALKSMGQITQQIENIIQSLKESVKKDNWHQDKLS